MKGALARLLGHLGQCLLLLIAALLLAEGHHVTEQAWWGDAVLLRVLPATWQATWSELVIGLIAWLAVGMAIFPPLPRTSLPVYRWRYGYGDRLWKWMALGLGLAMVVVLVSRLEKTPIPASETTVPATQPATETMTAAPWWPGQAAVLRTLPLRLHLQPSAAPEVLLRLLDPSDTTADLAGRSYVTAFAMGKFEHGAWSLSPPLTNEEKQREPQVFPQRRGRSILHEIQPLRRDRKTPLLLSLQGRMATEARPVASPWRRAEWQLLATASEVPASESRPLLIDDLDDSARPVSATAVPSCWLKVAVSDEQDQALRRLLAADVAGRDSASVTPSWKQRLIALRDNLRGRYQHTLAIDNPRGKEPLSHFLLDEKKGHCELFATAAALAARQMGVPSRVAYGWQGGRPDAAGRWLVFAAEHAHAWAEVLIADQGWVVLDATPLPQQNGDNPDLTPATTTAANLPLTSDNEEANQAWQSNWRLLLAKQLKKGSVPVAMAALLAIVVCWLTVRWLRTRKRAIVESQPRPAALPLRDVPSGFTLDPPSSAVLTRPYLTCFLQQCQQMGLQPMPGDTVGQLAARWSQRPPWLEDLVRYHYGTSYDHQPRNATTEQHWCELLQAEK